MNKYFKRELGHRFYEQHDEWIAENEKVRKAVASFMDKNGIEANEFRFGRSGIVGEPCEPGDEKNIFFGIVPTENDIERFLPQFKKCQSEVGLRYFKKNSELMKCFAATAIENRLRNVYKPSVGHLFGHSLGGYRSRLFKHDGVLYGSIETERISDPHEVDGIIEMKASEFYKLLEDIESEREKAEASK